MTTMTLRTLASRLEKNARRLNEAHIEALRSGNQTQVTELTNKFNATLAVLSTIGNFNPSTKIDISDEPELNLEEATHDGSFTLN
jgi:biopolymer transport protein ExbB/TolQ